MAFDIPSLYDSGNYLRFCKLRGIPGPGTNKAKESGEEVRNTSDFFLLLQSLEPGDNREKMKFPDDIAGKPYATYAHGELCDRMSVLLDEIDERRVRGKVDDMTNQFAIHGASLLWMWHAGTHLPRVTSWGWDVTKNLYNSVYKFFGEARTILDNPDTYSYLLKLSRAKSLPMKKKFYSQRTTIINSQPDTRTRLRSWEVAHNMADVAYDECGIESY
jgi:hypothetical protein